MYFPVSWYVTDTRKFVGNVHPALLEKLGAGPSNGQKDRVVCVKAVFFHLVEGGLDNVTVVRTHQAPVGRDDEDASFLHWTFGEQVPQRGVLFVLQ